MQKDNGETKWEYSMMGTGVALNKAYSKAAT
jgi:hypothetical protein